MGIDKAFYFGLAVVAVIGLGLWVANEAMGEFLCPEIDDNDSFWKECV